MFSVAELMGLVTGWFWTSGFKVLLVLIGAYVAHFIASRFLGQLLRRTISRQKFVSEEAKEKRIATLTKIVYGTSHIVILLVALLMVLSNLGVSIAPLLAAAGVAGIALGFGGQYIIKDVLTGLFIILENQYRVSDVVCLGDTCGLVEDISIRMTTLRDLDGTVHHVPNGEITRVSNLSKYYSRVNMNIRVAYESDLEHVIRVVNQVGSELAEDPAWKDSIITPPQFLRVDDFADSAIIIKILGDTKPIKQWDVAGELRKRLKIAFDKEGIEIPFPQRVMTMKGSAQ